MKTKLFILLSIIAVTACTSKKPIIISEEWGSVDSKPVYLFTLTNSNGMSAKITNYGCIIVEFNAPDRNGQLGNITLGLESFDDYLAGHPYFGSIVGRYADVIAGAKFTLDSVEYTLTSGGHGGRVGFDKKVWDATTSSDKESATLSLTYLSVDGEEGYPGNLTVKLDYVLNNDNELQLRYTATTDKPTVLNLTNHIYFNLAACKEDVLGHHVIIYANTYPPYGERGSIPTGEIEPLEGTPLDLRQWTVIGDRIPDLQPRRTFDHYYIVNETPGNIVLAAELYEPKSGRLLQTYTTEPGLQFYIPADLSRRNYNNRQGIPYTHFMGACFEAQHYANSPNTPNFPSTVLRPGETYTQITKYKVGVR